MKATEARKRRKRGGLASRVALVGLALVLAPGSSRAGATIGIDVPTLNVLLPALTREAVEVPVAGRSLRIELAQLQVTGFDPAAGKGSAGQIRTRMRVRVPELGLDVPIEPRLSLRVVERGSASSLELRFEEANLPLPMLGRIDLSAFLPPLVFPADNVWVLAGSAGDVEVRSRLADVRMGKLALEFEFDLTLEESPAPVPAR